MKKFLGSLTLIIFVTAVNIGFAYPNNPATMKALKSNPQNYIYYGYTGPGGSLYIDKSSINVERYAPPHYVIKFKAISYDVFSSRKYANEHWEKYYYNYNTKEMFHETTDGNNNPVLKPLDEKKYSKLPANQMCLLNGGEIAFYLAYKINFYGEPISVTLKSYLKSGTWSTFGSE